MSVLLNNELKQLRADLDIFLTMANELRDLRETNTAYTKLEEAKMHVGNTLYEIGAAKVYIESKNPDNDKIDAYHIDYDITPNAVPKEWYTSDVIGCLKIMRRDLDSYLVRAKNILELLEPSQIHVKNYALIFATEAIVRLREAQNWYGAELGRLRDTNFKTVPV